MDPALQLKYRLHSNPEISRAEVESHLNSSPLFNQLLQDFEMNIMNLLWRLTQLAEIPYAGSNKKVVGWASRLVEATYTGSGFSLNGKDDYMLACYNGMITSLLMKLKLPMQEKIEKGIEWILKYQHVRRGEVCHWPGSGLKKYGGCMKSTPCYIGLVKSMIALSDYLHADYSLKRKEAEEKLNHGLDYILAQNVFQRRSDKKPITSEITKLTYPFTWKTNIIEILLLLKNNNRLSDPRCSHALAYLKSRQKKGLYWQNQYAPILKNKVWIPFDETSQPGAWITHEINEIVKGVAEKV